MNGLNVDLSSVESGWCRLSGCCDLCRYLHAVCSTGIYGSNVVSRTLHDIVIVGCGLAGLTLAISLARLGIKSVVIEKRSSPQTGGMGIQITPNASYLLARLGLNDQLAAIANVINHIVVRDSAVVHDLFRLDVGKFRDEWNLGYLTLERGELLDVLIEHARNLGVVVHFNENVVEFPLEGDRYGVRRANGTCHFPQILVGADGVASRVNRLVNPGHRNSRSSYSALRMVVPMNEIPDHGSLSLAQVTLTYTRTCHTVAYPINKGRFLNLVAVVPASKPASKALDELSALLDRFQSTIDIAEASTGQRYYDLRPSRVHPVWSVENTCLIGDALHPLLPFLAQGGNMAIEDGWVLASAIAGSTTPKEAFDKFKKSRQRRIGQVVRGSNLQAFVNRHHNSFYHSMRTLLLSRIHKHCPRLIASSYDNLYAPVSGRH